MTKERNCGNCVFYNPDSRPSRKGKEGHCRRYPPVITGHETSEWPDTAIYLWCGEFQEAPKDDEPGPLES